jgi:PleD family two-component response regulator
MASRCKQDVKRDSRTGLSRAGSGFGTTRILLADDHEIVRKGLRHILADSIRGSYGEASNSGEIIRMVREKKWDLVILVPRSQAGGPSYFVP